MPDLGFPDSPAPPSPGLAGLGVRIYRPPSPSTPSARPRARRPFGGALRHAPSRSSAPGIVLSPTGSRRFSLGGAPGRGFH